MARIGNRSEMEAFVRAVELGNLSAAARELELTPSALSKLVTRLERALKVRLLSRNSRRILPTPEGERFLARCRRILAEIEDAETEATGSRERPRGRLRMSAGPGFGMGPLATALPRFLERHPEVQVDLVLEDRVMDVVRDNLDIAVTVWRPQSASLVVKEIFEFGRITCAAPSYLKRHGKPRSLDEVARHRWLRVVSMLSTPLRFSTTEGVRTFEVQPTLIVNNAEMCLQMAIAGCGMIQMMEFQVAQALRDGRLVRVLPEYPCPDRLTMLAVYAHERHRLPRVRAMLDYLFEVFGDRPAAKQMSPCGGASSKAIADRK